MSTVPVEVMMVYNNQTEFSAEFMDFIPANLHVYRAFDAEAKKVIAMGFQHYSSRTIIEVLRHHTNLRQNGDEGQWKLNDHCTPYMARLFVLMNPMYSNFFSFRTTPTTNRAVANA